MRKMYRVKYSFDGSRLVSETMYSAINTCLFIRSLIEKSKSQRKIYGSFVERQWSLGNWETYEDSKLYDDLEEELKPIKDFIKKNEIEASDLSVLFDDVESIKEAKKMKKERQKRKEKMKRKGGLIG